MFFICANIYKIFATLRVMKFAVYRLKFAANASKASLVKLQDSINQLCKKIVWTERVNARKFGVNGLQDVLSRDSQKRRIEMRVRESPSNNRLPVVFYCYRDIPRDMKNKSIKKALCRKCLGEILRKRFHFLA